jgi:tetratricopeptide (TPR) repeat protein
MLLEAQGDYAAAEPLYRRALAIAEKAQGPEHPSTGTILNNLAGLLEAQGDYASAEPLYRRALAIAEKAQGEDSTQAGLCLYRLGNVLEALGRIDEADSLLRRELAIAMAGEGKESLSVATSLRNLGVMLRNAGRLDEAAGLLEEALAIHRKRPSADADLGEMTAALSALGQARGLQERWQEAKALLEECLSIRTASLEPGDERIALVERRLAEVRERIGDKN